LSTIEECSNDLLGVLNSDNANLRPGNPNWNRSVSSAYDPDVAAYNSDENCFVLTEEDSIRITNLIEFTLGEAAGVPNTKNALFFYSAYGEDNLPILYSSQNEFGLRTSRYTVCNETIVYYNYVKKEPLSIDYDELQQMTELEIINSHIANSSAT
jgi:hypothetical protein